MPFDMPRRLLNRWTISQFNRRYYNRQSGAKVSTLLHYDPFFYPLDRIQAWNRLYGRRGFLQYQCVIPSAAGKDPVREIWARSSRLGLSSFLTVLKAFGDRPSPGMMSFPQPGITLAMDIPFEGESTLKALNDLYEVVRDSRGAVYPAKDARMSPESFQVFFPQWRQFAAYVDPCFSSSFWQRVTGL